MMYRGQEENRIKRQTDEKGKSKGVTWRKAWMDAERRRGKKGMKIEEERKGRTERSRRRNRETGK